MTPLVAGIPRMAYFVSPINIHAMCTPLPFQNKSVWRLHTIIQYFIKYITAKFGPSLTNGKHAFPVRGMRRCSLVSAPWKTDTHCFHPPLLVTVGRFEEQCLLQDPLAQPALARLIDLNFAKQTAYFTSICQMSLASTCELLSFSGFVFVYLLL